MLLRYGLPILVAIWAWNAFALTAKEAMEATKAGRGSIALATEKKILAAAADGHNSISIRGDCSAFSEMESRGFKLSAAATIEPWCLISWE